MRSNTVAELPSRSAVGARRRGSGGLLARGRLHEVGRLRARGAQQYDYGAWPACRPVEPRNACHPAIETKTDTIAISALASTRGLE